MGEAQRQRLQTAAEVAAAEVGALEREVQNLTAAGQLAGMVADRAASADYRSRLGVMTQIREDFTRMAALLADATTSGDVHPSTAPAGAGADDQDGLTIKDRDGNRHRRGRRHTAPYRPDHPLHRRSGPVPATTSGGNAGGHPATARSSLVCRVVAVDPRWLLRAIAAHYRDLLQVPAARADSTADAGPVDPDDEELWNSTPAQYLEKIFQVVLTLPPLDNGGYQRLLRTLVGTRSDQFMPQPSTRSEPHS